MAITLNITAIMISLAAILLALWQALLSRGGNHLPVILEAFKLAHDPDSDYLNAEKYILNDLAQEHAVDCGITGLPEPARSHVLTIGMFFDDLGKTVAHDMIHQDVVVGSFGPGMIQMWDALAPYVYQQRRASNNQFWVYFEDLTVRAVARPSSVVHAALRLRSRPPHQEPRTSLPDD